MLHMKLKEMYDFSNAKVQTGCTGCMVLALLLH